jgi:antitoxin YefM
MMVSMETIPITEAKARIAELAERVAREHDHFTITRNGRADVMLISVAEYESMQETLDILGDSEAVADLRQSREDFAAGDTYTAAQVRAELEQRRRLGQARRNIRENLPLEVALAAMETIDGSIAVNPYRAGKPLDEPFDGYYSARRGTYRIIYRIDEAKHQVEVHSIRHRRDAYRA